MHITKEGRIRPHQHSSYHALGAYFKQTERLGPPLEGLQLQCLPPMPPIFFYKESQFLAARNISKGRQCPYRLALLLHRLRAPCVAQIPLPTSPPTISIS